MVAIPDTGRPSPGEYAPFYESYVRLVPETGIDEALQEQLAIVGNLLDGLSEDLGGYRYAPNKWSVRELIGHLIDTEWVFAGRALWIARGGQPLPGMDQDEFCAAAHHDRVSLADLRWQFLSIREAGLAQYRTFSASALSERGVASGCEFSVRSLLFILVGHVRHHLRVLEERYLISAG